MDSLMWSGDPDILFKMSLLHIQCTCAIYEALNPDSFRDANFFVTSDHQRAVVLLQPKSDYANSFVSSLAVSEFVIWQHPVQSVMSNWHHDNPWLNSGLANDDKFGIMTTHTFQWLTFLMLPSWRRTFSALLALLFWVNRRWPFLHKGPLMRSFDVFSRGQFWPPDIVVAYACVCVVCPCVR